MSTAIIFSDLHLPNEKTEDYELFLKTLKSLENKKHIHEVWLIGDIFDCLVGDQKFWISMHLDFWTQLESLAKLGKKILYFEGNHDFGFKKIAIQHGVQAFTEGRCHLFHGRRVFLSHGDEVDTDDETYARWRNFIKSQTVRDTYRKIPETITRKFLVPFAETYSGYRKRKKVPTEIENEVIQYKEKFRGFAENLIREKSYHAVFLGHSHIKELSILGSTSFYCNLGSWLGEEKPLALWNPEEQNFPEICSAVEFV